MNAEPLKEQLSHSALSKLLDPVNAHQVCLTQSHGAHRYKALKVDRPTPPRMRKRMIKKETKLFLWQCFGYREPALSSQQGPFQQTVMLAE